MRSSTVKFKGEDWTLQTMLPDVDLQREFEEFNCVSLRCFAVVGMNVTGLVVSFASSWKDNHSDTQALRSVITIHIHILVENSIQCKPFAAFQYFSVRLHQLIFENKKNCNSC